MTFLRDLVKPGATVSRGDGVPISVSPCASFTYTNGGEKSDQPVTWELVEHPRTYQDGSTVTIRPASSRPPSSRDPQVRHDRPASKRVNIHISHTHTCGRPLRVTTIRDMWTCGLEFDQPELSRANATRRFPTVPSHLFPFLSKLLACCYLFSYNFYATKHLEYVGK